MLRDDQKVSCLQSEVNMLRDDQKVSCLQSEVNMLRDDQKVSCLQSEVNMLRDDQKVSCLQSEVNMLRDDQKVSCLQSEVNMLRDDQKVSCLQSEVNMLRDDQKVSCLQSEVNMLRDDQKVSCLQSEVNMLRDDVKKVKLQIQQYPPVDFVMYNYKTSDSEMVWHSNGFYTHPSGYKMCLTVYPNGVGRGRDSHVSVFATLMKGEYDDDLRWPFRGHVTVELLDIEEDYDDYYEDVEDVFKFNTHTPARAASRPVDGERNEYGHGNAEFIYHDHIPDWVNTLHFRVTRVTLF